MSEEKRIGWHFLPADGKLANGDGRTVTVGETYSVDGEISICKHGLHASERIIDALQYADGPVVCQVEVWGDVQAQKDKICGRNRKVLSMVDITDILHEFACRCAEDVLSRVDNPDPSSVAAIRAKRDWVAGRISDRDLGAARSAALYAAKPAALDAAKSAALYAARDAAMSEALDAAKSAALYAARDAAMSEALDAAKSAAWSAAWFAAKSEARSEALDAAWSAARDAQNKILTDMVMAAISQ